VDVPEDDAGAGDEDDWRDALADRGELTPAITERILDAHGDRGQRAIEAASEGRVKQYEDFTVVVGHDDEYIVEAGSCNCEDAQYNLGPEESCWHALAAAIAAPIGEVDHHDMYYSEVRDFL
jgi:predicted nucleic acid-binding Zn finger protein